MSVYDTLKPHFPYCKIVNIKTRCIEIPKNSKSKLTQIETVLLISELQCKKHTTHQAKSIKVLPSWMSSSLIPG